MSATRLARAATAVAVFGLISRFLGLGREMVLAGSYGNSPDADAFVNALFIVNTVAAMLLYALVTVVIPVFSTEREQHGERSAWRLVWAIAAWVGLGLIVFASLVALFPGTAAAVFSLDAARAATTETLIRIMAPAILFQGLSAVFTAMLQVHGRFGVPAAVGVAFNLGIIIGVVAGRGSIGIHAAAWGVTAGALLQVLLQLPQFVRVARGQRTRPTLLHPRLRSVVLLSLPVLGASAVQQINGYTDKLLASSLQEGRVAALTYANSLGAAPRTALLLPLLTPLFPLIARQVAEGRDTDAVRGMHRVAGLLGLVAVPVAVLLAVYARETAQLLLGRGRCDSACIDQVAPPFVFYAVALVGNFLSIFFNRALAAARLQRQILVATVVVVIVTVALDVALLGPMEQAGLAAASAVGVYLNMVLYARDLRARFPEFSLRRLARQQGRLLMCGVPVVGVMLLADRVVPTGRRSGWDLVPPLALKVAVGLAVYAAAAMLLARPELREGRGALAALVRRRRPAVSGG